MLDLSEEPSARQDRRLRQPSWLRHPFLTRGAWFAFGLVALGALLEVNLFPVVTQDSLVYLDYSQMIGQEGLVIGGFRQVGYPIFLAATRGLAGFLNADPLMIAALSQRLLFVAAAGLATFWWRWWAVPLLVLILSSETIAYTNLLLNEGLAISLALLASVIVAYLFQHLRLADPLRERLAIALAVVVATLSLYLFLMRFTYIVFAVAPVILALAAWHTPLRRQFVWISATFLACLATVAMVMSVENSRTLGTFTPAAGGEPTSYYYAWTQVFEVRPENQARPELATFYDGGQLRDFIFEVGQMDMSLQEERMTYKREIRDMLEAAGLSGIRVRAESGLWAVAGGRIDDVEAAVDRITSSTRKSVETAIYRNSYAAIEGQRAFHSRYNDGRPVGVVITDPIGKSLPVPAPARTLRLFLPLSVVVLGFLAVRNRSLLALTALLVVTGTSAGLGLLMADNLRFLFPAALFAVGTVTALIARSPTNQE